MTYLSYNQMLLNVVSAIVSDRLILQGMLHW